MKTLIRSIQDSDFNFIISTWLKSYYDLMTGQKPPKFVYFKAHEKIIKEVLLAKDGFIICNDEDHDQIMGYIITNGKVLHYVYVKNLFRNLGFAKILLASKKLDTYTHHTSYIRKLKLSYTYNPYLFKEGNNDQIKDIKNSTINQEL
jgi:hypothetical protein